MKLSIVATLYQSAPYIYEFHERATATAKQLVGDDYEIVLVNDGSPDNSLDLAIKLTEQDSHVVVVDLSRNFGHHKAMMPGQRKAMDKSKPVNVLKEQLEKVKASIRAKVEHPFRVIKCQFGHRMVRYRVLAKNTSQLLVMFAMSNLWMVRKRILQGLKA